MHASQKDLEVLHQQLEQGSIQTAYRALIYYMISLRAHFVIRYGEPAVSALYQGFMDMTYFGLVPPAFKRRDLKLAVVFNYTAFRFEAWLAARNRKVQRQYWELFRHSSWPEYRVVTPAVGIDSIVECGLADGFDLADPDSLTARIESGTAAFIADMEKFLSERQP